MWEVWQLVSCPVKEEGSVAGSVSVWVQSCIHHSLWFTKERDLETAAILTHTHTLLCVFGAPPHRRSGHLLTLCRHLQRRPDTDSRQQTSAEGKLLSSCLCSFYPATFIISSSLRLLQSSIISASLFARLVFATGLTTALQCRQRCISTLVFLSSFLPARCLTQRLLRSRCMHSVMCFCFPQTRHARKFNCGQNIWGSAETANILCFCLIWFMLCLM